MNTSALPPLALIAGPTASGKSALAVALAERNGGVVINADSAQVYTDLRVLSARPSEAEMAGVPHRLFGHVDGADTGYSAARWATEARAEIARAHAAGRLPVLVGGTGLYLRTLIDGIAPVPAIDPAVRVAVRALPVAEAHAALVRDDPAAGRRLGATDTTRVARALEVVRSSGRPLAEWQRHHAGGIGGSVALVATILLPDRDWLTKRCDARFAAMLDGGAREEVQRLLARALPADVPVMRAIGVREVGDWIAGRSDRQTALDRGRIVTRRYAKRQYTWFRNQPPPGWQRSAATETDANLTEIERRLR